MRESLESYRTKLQTGDLKNDNLLVAKSVRQKVNEYKVDNLTALALRQLDAAGIEIHPGEKVNYLIKDAEAKNKEERVRAHPFLSADDLYDEDKYRELLENAAEEVGLEDSNPSPPPVTPLLRWERTG